MSKGKRFEEPKLNKKKVLAVIVLFIVIIMCIIMLVGILNEGESLGNVSNINYFAAYQDNKWGVIDSNGDIVINPSYAEMIIIPNSEEDVFLCTYDVNYDDGTYSTQALNSENRQIFTDYEQIEAISSVDENNNLSYNSNVLKVQKSGKYGLINLQGEEVLACEYDEITALQGVENALLVLKEENYGLVNDEGTILLPTEYEEIQALGDEIADGFIVKNSEGNYGIVDSSNTQILGLNYEGISNIYQGDYYVVIQDGKQLVVSKDGTEVLNGNYDEIIAILKNPENGVIYRDGEQYGVMNMSGEIIINPTYDELKEAKTGIFIAKTGNNYGIINLSEEIQVEFNYSSIMYYEKPDLYVTEDESFNNQILDSSYNVRLTGILIDLDEDKEFIEIRQDDEYKYYNFRFEEENESDIFTSNTLFLSKKDGKYGFVDEDGNVVVDYIYDDAENQNSFGFAAVKLDGKWGAIDSDGNVVQEPTYNLDDYLKIDFIGSWYLGKDLNMNYYRK